ncbi:hypothetical protein DSO57_1038718 [Entomophthora muscae]|uniref:Uncharacterized protein n=1 Tax=Entomophthora muscae TaxID=34485 RepID=A0ACC2RDB1_9FUNG|nr:hypothetical protein DSO57_1038718 [Entomophthora muscae]
MASRIPSTFWIDSQITRHIDLPLGNLYAQLIPVSAPLLTSCAYLVVVALWSHVNRRQQKPHSGGPFLKAFVVLHNLALMVFSLLTFYHTAAILYQSLTDSGPFQGRWCDVTGKYWKSGFFYWGWLFYLSKYYELLDTVIILIKGRTPSFLQSYHHAGAIIGMWFLIANATPGAWIFITFNSFIHTIMYTYYIFATLGYRLPGKKYITYMQITQFIVGCTVTTGYLYFPNCTNPHQLASIIFNLAYVTPLIFLFSQFARATYFS